MKRINVDLAELQAFACLAELRSFRAAADEARPDRIGRQPSDRPDRGPAGHPAVRPRHAQRGAHAAGCGPATAHATHPERGRVGAHRVRGLSVRSARAGDPRRPAVDHGEPAARTYRALPRVTPRGRDLDRRCAVGRSGRRGARGARRFRVHRRCRGRFRPAVVPTPGRGRVRGRESSGRTRWTTFTTVVGRSSTADRSSRWSRERAFAR